MGLPPNHPKLDHFSIETHGFGGNPIVGTPPCISETDFRKKGKNTRKGSIQDPAAKALRRKWEAAQEERDALQIQMNNMEKETTGAVGQDAANLFPCSPARRRQLLIDSPINTEKAMEIVVLLGNHLDSCWIFNTYWRADFKIETRD